MSWFRRVGCFVFGHCPTLPHRRRCRCHRCRRMIAWDDKGGWR